MRGGPEPEPYPDPRYRFLGVREVLKEKDCVDYRACVGPAILYQASYSLELPFNIVGSRMPTTDTR